MFRNFKKAVIRKPDLDTCLAGVIMGIHPCTPVLIVQSMASDNLLSDPRILCIECGGSGLTHLGNLDHHDPEHYYPPACRQALNLFNYPDYELHRLVEYVCMIDEAIPLPGSVNFPSLSSVFSGMLLCEKDTSKAFQAGMKMLKLVLEKGIDPLSTMPTLKGWTTYIETKISNQKKLDEDCSRTIFMNSKHGFCICYLKSENIGGTSRLYKMGCQVVILHNPAFGTPPVNKYTIAGNGIKVSGLLDTLDKLEKGWGGRSCIIGSPFSGSMLKPDQILEIVSTGLT